MHRDGPRDISGAASRAARLGNVRETPCAAKLVTFPSPPPRVPFGARLFAGRAAQGPHEWQRGRSIMADRDSQDQLKEKFRPTDAQLDREVEAALAGVSLD